MLSVRVIPCLLLQNRGLVKTVKFKNPKYIGDPINAVRIFNEKEVDELIFLDIDASRMNRNPDIALIQKISSESFMPFSYGGGIRDMDTIYQILRNGAEKVVVNSYAVDNPEFIREASGHFGSQSIVVSMDIRKKRLKIYEIHTHTGSRSTNLNPIEYAQKMEDLGAGELFINSIDKDGTMEGYEIEIIEKIADCVQIPTIVCGGAGTLHHLSEAVERGHASAVAAGSLFVFYGARRAVLINYPSQDDLKHLFENGKI